MGFRGLSPWPHREEVGTSAFAMTIGSPRGRFKKNLAKSDNNRAGGRAVLRAHMGSAFRHTNRRPPLRHSIVPIFCLS